ncbi:dehydrogenase [Desulfitobacterium hafniense]|uniref:Dehydrogenase n=1 Tax=Desulfitobacterium hafniense TaxID=49338 RepID=A0A0W1JLM2_DESHA|nr:molybdopterin-dependent oxidoreductase [Desulfitobacterium hafniense]KTE92413.1 dehydrogenase [Desulfitobacterium hafniense]
MSKSDQEGFVKNSFTRRTFLKGAAAATVVTGVAVAPGKMALQALAETDENAEVKSEQERIFSGACRGNCCGGCFLNIHVRNGKVVKTSAGELPDPEYNNRICLKGLSHVQRIYHPERLKYPMKRVGERGAGQWERISWDEAINTITDKWKDLWSKYDKTAVAVWNSSGNFASINGNGGYGRFKNLLGATQISGASDMALIGGSRKALGVGPSYNSNEMSDMKNAKCIIVWGCNPSESQLQSWRFIADAIENGAKLIVIDPTFTTSAAKAHKYVPLRPGSDSALALAMMNVVIEEGLTDEPFMKKSTVAPLLVKENDGKFLRQSDITGVAPVEKAPDPFLVWNSETNAYGLVTEVTDPALRGTYTINGINVTTAYDLLVKRVEAYPPTVAQEICDVPAEVIREITHIYVKNSPSTIFQGYGLDHYVNGHYAHLSVMTLAMITGNLAKPGASAGLVMPLDAFWSNDITKLKGATPGPTISALKLPVVMETGMFGKIPVQIKSLFVADGNPLGNSVDRNLLMGGFVNKLDLIVVADTTMTDTAQYADILLPAAHWFEVNDIFGAYSPQPYLMLQEKAVDPLFECKSDLDIMRLITNKLGIGEAFNLDDIGFIDLLLQSPAAKAKGITLKKMQKDKVVRVLAKPCIHGEGGVFPTPTGRAQFYMETPTVDIDYGQKWDIEKERLPYFEPPAEAWPQNPLFKKYPLTIFQEHSRWRTHTQWGNVPWLRELDPEPTVKINPDDAAARGIENGDIVEVFNDRGHVVLKAVINNGMRSGTVNIPKGWQRGQFIEGHYQELTSRVTNPVVDNSAYFDVLVEVKKYKGGK